MAYKRKTVDVWHLLTNYGQGWEHECTELTREDARAQRQCYRDNVPGVRVRLKLAREPVTPELLADIEKARQRNRNERASIEVIHNRYHNL